MSAAATSCRFLSFGRSWNARFAIQPRKEKRQLDAAALHRRPSQHRGSAENERLILAVREAGAGVALMRASDVAAAVPAAVRERGADERDHGGVFWSGGRIGIA